MSAGGIGEGGNIDPALKDRLLPVFRASQVGACVSSVAHDINNYLGAILAYAELLQQNPELPAEAGRMLGNIVASVRKSSELVSTLTSVARKERADINMISVPEFLGHVLDLKRYDFRAAHVGLDLDCPEQLPSLLVDRPRITMTLLYLLINALEAVEGTERPRVDVRAAPMEDGVEIAVKDSGPEIPVEIRERMFAPFFTTKPAPHLGLGLTLGRELARFHKGDLCYEEPRGFVLAIPLATGLKVS